MNPDPQENSTDHPAELHSHIDDAHSDAPQSPPPPPATPRPITFHVRLRALLEPRARFWALAALVLTVIAIGFLIESFRARTHEAWLIANGTPIEAYIAMANEEWVPNRPQSPDSIVVLRFTWKGETFDAMPSKLPGRRERIVTATKIAIRVNPNDREDWTWLNAPLPWLERGIATIITVPIALLAMLWTNWKYRRILGIWRDGVAEEALIVSMRSTAVAPRSRAAQVTPVDETNKRIYTVFLPPHLADMEAGEPLHMIRPSARSSSAIAAAWFE